jgi:ParB family chromosome partitioning protein
VYRDIENKIKTVLGTKVSIRNKSNDKGKIEIEYYSQAELERIINMLQTVKG